MYQNKEIVIDFSPVEGVSALHMDEFPLSFLGRMEIGRASTIDFNPETQRFDISLKEGTRYIYSGNFPRYLAGHDIPEASMPSSEDVFAEDGILFGPANTGRLYPASACGFAGYDEARGFEVAWIQECMKRGVDPLDSEGIEIIDVLRVSSDSPQL